MRPRIVLLEGPDGAGKTTLANVLGDRLGLPVHHCGPPGPMGAFEEYSILLSQIERPGAVIDRFHLGERVYGPVFRGEDTLGDRGQVLIEKTLLRKFCTALVMCIPSWRTVRYNWESRRGREMLQEEAHLQQVYEMYCKIETKIPLVPYDYQHDKVEDALARIYSIIDR